VRAALILLCLITATGLETLLLHAFVFHPAWGLEQDVAQATFANYLSWAVVPLFAAVLVLIAAAALRRPFQRVTRPLLFISAIGPLLAFIALRQISHSAAGFLAIGFLIQCGAILYAGFKLRNAT
jgi:uncharacterized membrane protein YoaK (UPF0700 family)